jgi:hypothetical protein
MNRHLMQTLANRDFRVGRELSTTRPKDFQTRETPAWALTARGEMVCNVQI